MPSVLNSRCTERFAPMTCEICYKTLGNSQALAYHLRTHMIDLRANTKSATVSSSIRPFDFLSSTPSDRHSSSYLATNIHQSLLSPSSFSIFNNYNGLVTNPNSNYNKANAGFNAPMKSFNNMFPIMETPTTLHNVILHDDGITRPFICQLDRPLPEIIELDSDDDEENEVHDVEMLDLNLKL